MPLSQSQLEQISQILASTVPSHTPMSVQDVMNSVANTQKALNGLANTYRAEFEPIMTAHTLRRTFDGLFPSNLVGYNPTGRKISINLTPESVRSITINNVRASQESDDEGGTYMFYWFKFSDLTFDINKNALAREISNSNAGISIEDALVAIEHDDNLASIYEEIHNALSDLIEAEFITAPFVIPVFNISQHPCTKTLLSVEEAKQLLTTWGLSA